MSGSVVLDMLLDDDLIWPGTNCSTSATELSWPAPADTDLTCDLTCNHVSCAASIFKNTLTDSFMEGKPPCGNGFPGNIFIFLLYLVLINTFRDSSTCNYLFGYDEVNIFFLNYIIFKFMVLTY